MALAAIEALRASAVATAQASEAQARTFQTWMASFQTQEPGSSQVVTPMDEIVMQGQRDVDQLKRAGFPTEADAQTQDQWLQAFMANPFGER